MPATRTATRMLRSKLLEALTFPHGTERYVELIDPLAARDEVRAEITAVQHQTPKSVTLTLAPNENWGGLRAGQFVNVGVEIDGRRQTRPYSPAGSEHAPVLELTVSTHPEGLVSRHLRDHAQAGMTVWLSQADGEFKLPDPRPDRILLISGGSGITPVMAMLRTLDRRGTMPDVVVAYSSPTADRMIFRDELREMSQKHEKLELHEQHTDSDGMLEMSDLERVCPDWKDRVTWACGPAPMLDAAEEHWEEAGLEDELHLERFTLDLGGNGAEGGTITFQNSGKTTEADGSTTIMEAGEEAGIGMPYGCRMGICHTCTLTLVEGSVRDLRSGEETSGPNEPIQTCITAAAGDCTLDI